MDNQTKPWFKRWYTWVGALVVIGAIVGGLMAQNSGQFQGMLKLSGAQQEQLKNAGGGSAYNALIRLGNTRGKSNSNSLGNFQRQAFVSNDCYLRSAAINLEYKPKTSSANYAVKSAVLLEASHLNADGKRNDYYANLNTLVLRDSYDGCQLRDFKFKGGSPKSGLKINRSTGIISYEPTNIPRGQVRNWAVKNMDKRDRETRITSEVSDSKVTATVQATDGGGQVHEASMDIYFTKGVHGQRPGQTDGNPTMSYRYNNAYINTSAPLLLQLDTPLAPTMRLQENTTPSDYNNDLIAYSDNNYAYFAVPRLPTALDVNDNNGEVYNQAISSLTEKGCTQHELFRVAEGALQTEWNGFIENSNRNLGTDVIQQTRFTLCLQ